LRCAIVTSQASTFASAGRSGYARNAARKVSDHASSASTGPTTARQTRSTVAPCRSTIASKGALAVTSEESGVLVLLEVEQEPFARQAAGVAGQRAVLADHAVARHDDGQRVAADGGADVARGPRITEFRGQIAVRPRFAVRD